MASTNVMMHQKVKILCTMGPAIASTAKITALVNAGANAFRLNMSHGSHESHMTYIKAIRDTERKLGIYLPIIADLQGPKIRVADFKDRESIPLVNGHEVRIVDASLLRSLKLKTSDEIIPVTYPTIAKDVKKGDVLLFDDGLLKVQVRDTDGKVVRGVVIHGGALKPRKGLNLPHTAVSQPALTTKDRTDVRFAIEQKVDYIALSFVRSADDVRQVRTYIAKQGGAQWVIAKIEKPEALSNIEAIVDASDAVMVARGDLGVEIAAAAVPIVQKRLIGMCNAKAKPVITATQMLESMIHAPRPTRAEASDIANAVLDGTDAVMLSAETSVGSYPIEAVHYMRTICQEAESVLLNDGEVHIGFEPAPDGNRTNTESVAMAVAHIAEEKRVAAIASLSYSGETARLISNRRPRAPIFAITSEITVARRMGLLWGVTGMIFKKTSSTDQAIEQIKALLVREKRLVVGSTVVFTIGRPLVGRARTNMLSIETL